MRTVLRYGVVVSILFVTTSAISETIVTIAPNCLEPNVTQTKSLCIEWDTLGYVEDKRPVCGPCECHLELATTKKEAEPAAAVQQSVEDDCHELVERFVAPNYPPIAKTAGIEGVVFAQVEIDLGGSVIAAHVVEGHPMLARAAIDAVFQWKFTLSETPVKMVALRFEISDDPDADPPRVQINAPDELQIVVIAPTLHASTVQLN